MEKVKLDFDVLVNTKEDLSLMLKQISEQLEEGYTSGEVFGFGEDCDSAFWGLNFEETEDE